MSHSVRFTPEALEQLDALEAYIAWASSPVTAARFIDSVVDYCESLGLFPHRGTRRDDLRQGLRTIGYRRRLTIAFAVTDKAVDIIGLYYGGRDVEAGWADESD